MPRISEVEKTALEPGDEIIGVVDASTTSSSGYWSHTIDGETFVGFEPLMKYTGALVRIRVEDVGPATKVCGGSTGAAGTVHFPPQIKFVEVVEPSQATKEGETV